MTRPLVQNPDRIRLGMIGMTAGNGHPFSWSAIINGRYDQSILNDAGYPNIGDYLGRQPRDAMGIAGMAVTHVYCDQPADAGRVAQCTGIPHIVQSPELMIDQIDAVLIATDIGSQHVDRAQPFIEAGIPVFVDKPMVDRLDHLQTMIAWHEAGNPLLSSSCMRYAVEYEKLKANLAALGELRLITVSMHKSWQRYGIHAIEAMYTLLPPGGYRSVINTGLGDADVVHIEHDTGVNVILIVRDDMIGGYGHVNCYGTKDRAEASFGDTFTAFKRQLLVFIDFLRTGVQPFAFQETVEQMYLLIAGMQSKQQGGVRIDLAAMVNAATCQRKSAS